MPFGCFGSSSGGKREKCKCTGCNCKQKKPRRTEVDGGKVSTATKKLTSRKNNYSCAYEPRIEGRNGVVNGMNGHYGANNPETPYQSVSKDALVYASNFPKRGKAVIFNFDKFDKSVLDYEPRQGSEKDKKDLTRCFQRLEFEVEIYDNLKIDELFVALTSLRNEDHRDCDMLVVAILTHGEHNRIATTCGTLIPVNSIWGYFEADKCPSLASKPKIFLIQACRGIKYDSGTELKKMNKERAEGDGKANDVVDTGSFSYVVPNAADIIVAFSCPYGYSSFRNPDEGSWFIQSFCKVMNEQAYNDDFASLLTIVAKRVALDYQSNTGKVESHNKKQVSSTLSTLIRKIVLKPKRKPKMLDSVDEDEEEAQEIEN